MARRHRFRAFHLAEFPDRTVRTARRAAPASHARAGLHVRAPADLSARRWQRQSRPGGLVPARRLRAGIQEDQGRCAHPQFRRDDVARPCTGAELRARVARFRRPPAVSRCGRCRPPDRAVFGVFPQRRQLRPVSRSAPPSHRAFRPGRYGHPRTPAPHLARSAVTRSLTRIRTRHPPDRRPPGRAGQIA